MVGMSQELSRMAAIRASCAARVATSIRLLHHRTLLYANLSFRKTIRRIIIVAIINIVVVVVVVVIIRRDSTARLETARKKIRSLTRFAF